MQAATASLLAQSAFHDRRALHHDHGQRHDEPTTAAAKPSATLAGLRGSPPAKKVATASLLERSAFHDRRALHHDRRALHHDHDHDERMAAEHSVNLAGLRRC
jgi:hypothetical protein